MLIYSMERTGGAQEMIQMETPTPRSASNASIWPSPLKQKFYLGITPSFTLSSPSLLGSFVDCIRASLFRVVLHHYFALSLQAEDIPNGPTDNGNKPSPCQNIFLPTVFSGISQRMRMQSGPPSQISQ